MPPLCYALVEDSYGSTTVEPVVVTRNPRNEDDMAARSAHPTQQFMTASRWLLAPNRHDEDTDEPDYEDWAYEQVLPALEDDWCPCLLFAK